MKSFYCFIQMHTREKSEQKKKNIAPYFCANAALFIVPTISVISFSAFISTDIKKVIFQMDEQRNYRIEP